MSHVQAQLSTVEMKKVDALVKQMTLEEKVGQMTQVTMAVYAENGWEIKMANLIRNE